MGSVQQSSRALMPNYHLSAMTFSHQLVRPRIMEQPYRAFRYRTTNP
ncbi:MAG: 23S rRNA (pseudouridine(1915)-N(3))-methyltransferase RlmH, partial [Sphingobacteriales bacterium]|nr:23S rRNA (pseudouridine(1915)-N(3))-methyltransferase RlmH [Sphingobacteriales bacterium]